MDNYNNFINIDNFSNNKLILNNNMKPKALTANDLKNILIKDENILKSKLLDFQSLSEYDKKIVILSSMFCLDLVFEIDDILFLITNEQCVGLLEARTKIHAINPNSYCDVAFTSLNDSFGLSAVGYNITMPTKSNTIFNNLDSISLNDLCVVASKGVSKFSDYPTYALSENAKILPLFYDAVASQLPTKKK